MRFRRASDSALAVRGLFRISLTAALHDPVGDRGGGRRILAEAERVQSFVDASLGAARMKAAPVLLPDGRHIVYHLDGFAAARSGWRRSIQSKPDAWWIRSIRRCSIPAVFDPPSYFLFLRGGR
jgi:hypothetical protein